MRRACPPKVVVTAAVILHLCDLSSVMRPPMQPPPAPLSRCGLLPQHRPPLLRRSLMVGSSHPAVRWISLLGVCPERQHPASWAKWIFRFLEGTVSSSGISLFKPSGKPRNSNRRRKKKKMRRSGPGRSNFHSFGGNFSRSTIVSCLVEVRSRGVTTGRLHSAEPVPLSSASFPR